jgi:hypothetical protein
MKSLPEYYDNFSPKGQALFIKDLSAFYAGPGSSMRVIHERFGGDGAVQAVAQIQELMLRSMGKIQELTTPSDWPQPEKFIAKVFDQVKDIDVGWQAAFDMIDLTASQRDSFTILDTTSGLTFNVVKPGGKAKIYKVSGTEVTVRIDMYGGALGWLKVWFDDARWWDIQKTSKEFRSKYYNNKAQVAYDLISASRADADVAWQGAENDDNATRDSDTINFACNAIIEDLEGLGMNVSPNTPFVIVAPLRLMGRINNALRVGYRETQIAGNTAETQYNVSAVFTTKLKNQALTSAEVAQYFVLVPGRKIMWGDRMDLTLLSDMDILAYAETVAGWGRYGGGIGEVKQLRRCKTA